MSYTVTLTITVPADLYEVACAIGRALDPDVGGADSFGPRTDVASYSMSTPCVPEFAAQAGYLISNPAALHYAVAADYAARWPGMTPPTLAECEAFCAGAVIGMPEAEQ